MRGVNKVIVVGNVGKDPETRYTPAGLAIASFSIATSESWKDKTTGEKQERTEWHRCTAFGKLAEIIGEYVKKGSQLYVEGSLRTEEYEKDGVKRYTTKIIVNEMRMLGGRPDSASERAPGRGRPQSAPQSAPHSAPAADTFEDDEIPF